MHGLNVIPNFTQEMNGFDIVKEINNQVNMELVQEIQSFFNEKKAEISKKYYFDFRLESSFELAKTLSIAEIKPLNSKLFLSAHMSDSNSLIQCLPKEICLYILQLQYPFLISFEEFNFYLVNNFKEELRRSFLVNIFEPGSLIKASEISPPDLPPLDSSLFLVKISTEEEIPIESISNQPPHKEEQENCCPLDTLCLMM